MAITLSRRSSPSMRRCAPTRSVLPCKCRASAGNKMAFTRELLPAPLTPVTAVRIPTGKRASMFLRLFSEAPRMTIAASEVRRALARGASMRARPERYAPVRLDGWLASSSGEPLKITRPPMCPPPRPKSTTRRVAEVVVALAHGHRRGLGDALAKRADGEALPSQPLLVARVARLLAHELSILVARGFRARLLEFSHQARNHALVAHAPGAVAL